MHLHKNCCLCHFGVSLPLTDEQMVFLKIKKKSKRVKRTLDEDSSDSEEGVGTSSTVLGDSTKEPTTVSNDQVAVSQRTPRASARRKGLMYGELTESEKTTGRFRFWNFQFKEKEESEKDGDTIVLAHYRTIKSFTASDPELTSAGKNVMLDEYTSNGTALVINH